MPSSLSSGSLFQPPRPLRQSIGPTLSTPWQGVVACWCSSRLTPFFVCSFFFWRWRLSAVGPIASMRLSRWPLHSCHSLLNYNFRVVAFSAARPAACCLLVFSVAPMAVCFFTLPLYSPKTCHVFVGAAARPAAFALLVFAASLLSGSHLPFPELAWYSVFLCCVLCSLPVGLSQQHAPRPPFSCYRVPTPKLATQWHSLLPVLKPVSDPNCTPHGLPFSCYGGIFRYPPCSLTLGGVLSSTPGSFPF